MVDFQVVNPALERILLLSWLLKDFGWMTTNIYFGFSFGFISVTLHFAMIFLDPRRAFKFYNFSLFFWVLGNYIWMTIEFVCTNPSSTVHIGPPVPLGGISDQNQNLLVQFKTVLFFIGAIIQITMYFGIYFNRIEVPEDDEEDAVSKNEACILFRGKSLDTDANQPSFSLSFLENAYIIFWISKDLFWSWGTGDLTQGHDLAIVFESIAMWFGTMSILIYSLTAYIYRRQIVRFVDSITTICWIMANYVWMCGEFFLRYQNLSRDDEDEGNDSATRIVSSILFCAGIILQIGNIVYISMESGNSNCMELLLGRFYLPCCCKRKQSSRRSILIPTIELFGKNSFSTNNDSSINKMNISGINTSPFHGKKSNNKHVKLSTNSTHFEDEDEDSESVVLF